jgi:hypothetical protein
LDALTSYLKGVLPAVRLQFPKLSILGISAGAISDVSFLADLELDGYVLTLPKPEDLIVRVPHLAASYLCDSKTLSVFEVQPIVT